MKANRQLPTRTQGDATEAAKEDASPRISGNCFHPFEALQHFEDGEVEARVQAGIESMNQKRNHKRVYRMNRKR